MEDEVSEVRLFMRPIHSDVSRDEVEDMFTKFGPVEEIKLMRGYGFVEFRNSDDARAAVNDLNGSEFHGLKFLVEFAKPRAPRRERDRDDYNDRYGRDRERDRGGRFGRDRDDYGRDRDGDRDRERDRERDRDGDRESRPNKWMHCALLTNLPNECSWQDLKDFARLAEVPITFADVTRRGEGAVAFESRDDLEDAIKLLDGRDFRGSTVNVEETDGATIAEHKRRSRRPPPFSSSSRRSFRDSRDGGRGGDRYRDRDYDRRGSGDYDRRRPPRGDGYRRDSGPPPPPRGDSDYRQDRRESGEYESRDYRERSLSPPPRRYSDDAGAQD